MSSGKGGSGKRTVYCGTIGGVLGEGPAHSFRQFLVNAKAVWTGPLLRAGASNPTTITLAGYGNAQLFFGTEDQPVSSVLARYGVQPAYRGSVVVVLDDIRFGNSGETNPPNLEVVWRREPDQDIVTTLTSDSAFTATLPAHAAELLTSWSWAGLPTSALNIPSFTALEAALVGDPRNAIAPLYTDQCSVRSALADCAAIVDAWSRVDAAGKIEVGLWPRGGPSGGVTAFSAEDFTDSPELEVDDPTSLPNAISVEFRDSTKLHKANATLVPDSAAIRSAGGRVRRQTAKRSMLNTLGAAKRHGADLLAVESRPGFVVTVSVFRSLAVRPDGVRIRPGDYFIAPVQLLPELPAVPRLFRCTRRSFKVRGPIKLTGELDRSAPAAEAVAAEETEELERVLPPVNWVRVFGAPAGSADLPLVYAVAARPADGCTGYDVRYDDSASGDYPAIGNEPGCALPLLLQADCSAAATEVTVRLLPVPASGANPRRDEHILRNWSGGSVEARDDRLLLVILKIAGDGQIEWTGSGASSAEYAEILSVAGPATIVDATTFTVPVLRGRMGTSARAFTAGAWSTVECWLVPSGALQVQSHTDWTAAATAGSTLYFRFRPYALGVEYTGETAYAERQRRAAAEEPLEEYGAQPGETDAPTIPYHIPAGYLPAPAPADMQPGTITDLNGGSGGFAPAGSMLVQSFGGDYTIHGTGPLDGIASTPPRRWLSQVWSGTSTYYYWGFSNTCGGAEDSNAAITLSGSAHASAATGAVTSTGLRRDTTTVTGSAPTSTDVALYLGYSLAGPVGPQLEGTRVVTATTDVATADNICHAGIDRGGGRRTGGWSTSISDECTEEVAIEAQSAGLAWSASPATAIQTERTELTFRRRKVRYGYGREVNVGTAADPVYELQAAAGGKPWEVYLLRATQQVRTVDSGGSVTGDWVDHATVDHLIQADIAGNMLLPWQEVEAPRGYELRVLGTLSVYQ